MTTQYVRGPLQAVERVTVVSFTHLIRLVDYLQLSELRRPQRVIHGRDFLYLILVRMQLFLSLLVATEGR